MPGTIGGPVFITSPRVIAIQGSSITLNCTATLPVSSTPGQCELKNCANISWIHDSKINKPPSERIFNDSLLTIRSRLELSSITTVDAGVYGCVVSITDNAQSRSFVAATVLTVSS